MVPDYVRMNAGARALFPLSSLPVSPRVVQVFEWQPVAESVGPAVQRLAILRRCLDAGRAFVDGAELKALQAWTRPPVENRA
jgi:hypothetical protein